MAGVIRGGWTVVDGIEFFAANAPMIRAGGTDIGTTLVGLPYPEAWNGSLWKLRYEVLCYIITGVALTSTLVRKHRMLIPVALAAATACSAFIHFNGFGGALADVALLVPYYLAVASIYVCADEVPYSRSLAILALVLFAATISTGSGRSLSALPLAYLFLWLGIAIPRTFAMLVVKNDFSYGTYLYAFPVQQILVISGAHHLGVAAFIVLSIAATAPLAVLSWFNVGRPANSLARPRRALAPVAAPGLS